MTSSLSGRVAVISGGTSGINLGIARTLAQRGADVVVFGRNAEKAALAAEEIMSIGGGDALGLAADVRAPDQVARIMETTVDNFGPPDIIIAGAAGNFAAGAVNLSPNAFKTVVDIDLLGAFNVFRIGYDYARQPGTSMIAISAPQAINPTMFQAHACAAKAGINMLVRCLALEWGQAGIRVNAISPGPIAATEGMARMAPTPELLEKVTMRTPLRRMGSVDDVGELAAFLCSEGATYITGTICNCDGGYELGDASRDAITRAQSMQSV